MTIKELEEKTGKEVVMRSCWNCNSAHKYLKKENYIIWCFSCGKLYYKGKLLKVKELLENESDK